jgi:hypothetical protein
MPVTLQVIVNSNCTFTLHSLPEGHSLTRPLDFVTIVGVGVIVEEDRELFVMNHNDRNVVTVVGKKISTTYDWINH